MPRLAMCLCLGAGLLGCGGRPSGDRTLDAVLADSAEPSDAAVDARPDGARDAVAADGGACGPGFTLGVDAGGACPTERIRFTQADGCTGDDSYELCLPDPARCPEALARAQAIAPDLVCLTTASQGRAGCDTSWQRLCMVPTSAESGRCATPHQAMTDVAWRGVCELAALPFVSGLTLTFYE